MNEFELIDHLTKDFKIYSDNVVKAVGDDCAVWKEGEEYRLFTTDSMVEGDHFIKEWFTPEQIGFRLMESNLSDIAAMGGIPTFLYVSMIIDNKTSPTWLKKVYSSFKTICDLYQITLMGGNITHGQTLSITIGLEGKAKNPVFRSGAKQGDLLFVTGTIGDACTARLMLKDKKQPPKELFQRLALPKARLQEGLFLADYASSMIDISDGIASEAIHLAKSSHCGVLIAWDKIPYSESAKNIQHQVDILDRALRGGEDYELMFTISESNFASMNKAYKLNTPLTQIGIMDNSQKYQLITPNGNKLDLPRGFDHFSKNINL